MGSVRDGKGRVWEPLDQGQWVRGDPGSDNGDL